MELTKISRVFLIALLFVTNACCTLESEDRRLLLEEPFLNQSVLDASNIAVVKLKQEVNLSRAERKRMYKQSKAQFKKKVRFEHLWSIEGDGYVGERDIPISLRARTKIFAGVNSNPAFFVNDAMYILFINSRGEIDNPEHGIYKYTHELKDWVECKVRRKRWGILSGLPTVP